MYKAIIWDLDGTLLDTTQGVLFAVNETINQLKLSMPSEQVLCKFVGPPMQLSFEKYYGMDEDKALEAANLFRKIYKENSLLKAELYPDVMEVLSTLKNKGYRMAVATNKSHDNAMQILQYFGIADFCDYMKGADLKGKLKKSDIINACIRKMKLNPDESLYIGDSIFDYEGAKQTGLNFLGVTYGFGFKENEEYEFDTIYSLKQLIDML